MSPTTIRPMMRYESKIIRHVFRSDNLVLSLDLLSTIPPVAKTINRYISNESAW